MTTGTISGTYTYGLGLSVNPTTVTASGVVAAQYDAIFGSGIAWTLTNSGFLRSAASDGVDLSAGGRVTNASSAAIESYSGTAAGVYIANAAGIVVNSGYIGAGHVGVDLEAGGSVTNNAGARLGAAQEAVLINGNAGTISNQGTIFSTQGDAVSLSSGGRVVNGLGGTITGSLAGVLISGDLGTVTNQAVILGAEGVELLAGGTIVNAANATISGDLGAYLQGGPSTLTNAGLIAGLNQAGVIVAASGGVVNNNAGGVISGLYGVELKSRASVTNASTIEGHAVGILAIGGAATVVNHGHVLASTGIDPGTTVTAANYGAIVLRAGGTVTNTGTVTDDAHDAILIRGAPGTVVNSGAIITTSTSAAGIDLLAGGSVTNALHATISGDIGVEAKNIAATVNNSGTITGVIGIYLQRGGVITNTSTGTISTPNDVAIESPGTVTLVNQGRITNSSTSGYDVLFGPGQITNAAGAMISGGRIAVFGALGGAETVVNQGVIVGTSYGVALEGMAETLINQAGAKISSANYDAVFMEIGTLTNAGTITDTGTAGAAVYFVTGNTHRLIVDPGAVFHGLVNGGNVLGSTVVSTMELASGAGAGTISGLGSQFINFGSVAVDAGASWNISGAATIGTGETITDSGTLDFLGGVANSGIILASGGTLFLTHGIASVGTVELKAHAVDSVTNTAAGFLQFLDATGTLDLNTPASFHSLIQGFVKGDVIDLINTPVTSITWTSPNLVVKDGTTTEATLHFSGSFTQSSFTFTSDGHSGTFIEHT